MFLIKIDTMKSYEKPIAGCRNKNLKTQIHFFRKKVSKGVYSYM